MKKSGTVTISHEHFKKSKLEYSNWMQAIFREAIQNSVDAGANILNIDYFKDEDNNLNLTFKDNGSGMSLDILLNVLLTMGGSKKDNDDAIGGFGYAKSILFFAHNEYTIKTNDIILKGHGGNYTYTENNNIVSGTEFNIVIENDYYHAQIERVEEYLREIIEFSYLPNITFIINNSKNPYKYNKYKFDLKSDLGDIQFSDNGYSNYSDLWIRINGLAMFKHSVYNQEKQSSFVGILNLNKTPLEALTANRDGLQYRYSSQLNSIFSRLSEEREKLTYNGMFNFVINEKYIEDESDNSLQEESMHYSPERFVDEFKKLKETVNNENNKQNSEEFIDTQLKRVFEDLSKEEDKFNLFFNRSIKKINQDYYPENFVISTEQNKYIELSTYRTFFSELVKKRNIKISIYWNTIINEILNVSYFNDIIESKDGVNYIKDYKVYTGFIFGNDTLLGANSFDKDTGYTISINPISSEIGVDFETIWDIAIHELTHFMVSNHNEVFCFEEFRLRRIIQKEINKNHVKKDILLKIKLLQNK